MPALTSFQVDSFRRTGYLKLGRIVPDELLSSAIDYVREAINSRVEPFRVVNGHIVRLDAVYQRGGPFKQLLTLPSLLESLESLLGPNIELLLNRHNHATLNKINSSSPRLHRDILQWSRSAVTAVIYLEQSTVENGCTWLIPGSQFLPFVGTPNNGGTWMDEHSIYSTMVDQAIPVPMPAGSVLLFDCLTFHTVGINRTPSTRISIAAAYHSIDELEDFVSTKRVLVLGNRLYRGNDQSR
jgi:phytanoyl-CoA hydroxylase